MMFPVATVNATRANEIDMTRPCRMVSTSLTSVIMRHQSRPAVCFALLTPLLAALLNLLSSSYQAA